MEFWFRIGNVLNFTMQKILLEVLLIEIQYINYSSINIFLDA